jgi:serine/threonine protein phosphatase PrpC
MKTQLKITLGQYSQAGRKDSNQDFHGATTPIDYLLESKGIAIAIADGISSSDVSQIASKTAVTGFLADYYCTSDAWSVKHSAQKVLQATNSWLFAQTQNSPHRFNSDKGYVCTFSAIIIKSNNFHVFHSGDSRIYRLANTNLEQLTQDHRRIVSEEVSYLTKALGIHSHLELDYISQPVHQGDIFILATDGIYEYIDNNTLINIISEHEHNLDKAAQAIHKQAYDNGSTDNLTIQIAKVIELPAHQVEEIQQQILNLPLPPLFEARMEFDGYKIIRDIYISSRSHVYLAQDLNTKKQVVLKAPSTELRDNKPYLECFLMEDRIARRIHNPYVLSAINSPRKRKYLYNVTEFIEGKSLSQWIIDNPKPNIDQVRHIINQVVKGLQAFHRQEMIHQDLRPNNIMIDVAGTAKIIDFGATKVGGILDIGCNRDDNEIKGTAQFSAPEYYLGAEGTTRSDIFSLGVITYHMFTGKLPYGVHVSKALTPAGQRKLEYRPILEEEYGLPPWVDHAIKKAVNIDPLKRYSEVSEFSYDLNQPSAAFLKRTKPPLMERDPLLFWKSMSLIFFIILVVQQLAGFK